MAMVFLGKFKKSLNYQNSRVYKPLGVAAAVTVAVDFAGC
jgi:hypothetical protein